MQKSDVAADPSDRLDMMFAAEPAMAMPGGNGKRQNCLRSHNGVQKGGSAAVMFVVLSQTTIYYADIVVGSIIG